MFSLNFRSLFTPLEVHPRTSALYRLKETATVAREFTHLDPQLHCSLLISRYSNTGFCSSSPSRHSQPSLHYVRCLTTIHVLGLTFVCSRIILGSDQVELLDMFRHVIVSHESFVRIYRYLAPPPARYATRRSFARFGHAFCAILPHQMYIYI